MKFGKNYSLERLFLNGNIAFYDYSRESLPDFVYEKKKGRVNLFWRGEKDHQFGDIAKNYKYKKLSKIRTGEADVCFFDNNSIKVLLAGFPVHPAYVLLRLKFMKAWIITLPGLLRRLSSGRAKIGGIIKIRAGDNCDWWLVTKNRERAKNSGVHQSLSSEIGIQGLVDFLSKNKINYVFLRFYEKLPALHREGGDLDILVSDEDQQKIKDFLADNPGRIPIDVHAVSGIEYVKIPYYPPFLARRILSSAVEGPIGSRIPSPKEAFLALAYHAVYHKGEESGISTSLSGVTIEKDPENDYAGIISSLAKKNGVQVNITLDDLDEYLYCQGWRPKLDTLAKIASKNEWVKKRFFSYGRVGEGKEIGLAVFIVKEKAVLGGVDNLILEELRKHKDILIIRTKRIAEKERRKIADNLRGGNWFDKSGSDKNLLPAIAILILNTRITGFSNSKFKGIDPEKIIKDLKKELRHKFDNSDVSMIHSSDNTREAWEYTNTCFPGEIDTIKKEVDSICGVAFPTKKEKVYLFVTSIPRVLSDIKHKIRYSFKQFIVKFFVE
jgi:hypothetical protein